MFPSKFPITHRTRPAAIAAPPPPAALPPAPPPPPPPPARAALPLSPLAAQTASAHQMPQAAIAPAPRPYLHQPPPPPQPPLAAYGTEREKALAETKEFTYQPRDTAFFHYAVVSLVAALLPPQTSADADDELIALRTAEAVAKVLDSGEVDRSFMTAKAKSAVAMNMYYDHKKLDGTSVEHASEGARKDRYDLKLKHIQMAAEQSAKNFVITAPQTAEEAQQESAATIAYLSDISDIVRAGALAGTLQRLTSLGTKLTGGNKEDAINVVIEEIVRSAMVAQRYNLPTHGLETTLDEHARGAISEEVASHVCAYPANRAVGAIQDYLPEVVQAMVYSTLEQAQSAQAQGTSADDAAPTETTGSHA